jgi:hypothetical protein
MTDPADFYPELLAAARRARREGWLPDELDPLHAAAHRLGIAISDAFAAQIAADAVRLEATT